MSIQSKHSEPIWTVPFILATLATLMVSIVNNIMLPILPLYAQHLGSSPSELGIILAMFPIAAMLSRPLSGLLTDKIGRKPVMLAGGLIFMAGTFLLSFAGDTMTMMLLRFLQGSGFSAISTATATMVVDMVPQKRLSEGIGYYSIAMTMGTAFGPITGQALLKYSGYSTLFLVSTGLLSVMLPITLFIRQKHVKSDKVTRFPQDFVEKSAVPAAIVMASVAMTLAATFSFIPALGEERGIENSGLFYTVYAIAILLIRIIAGKLSARLGIRKLMGPALFPMFIGLILIGLAPGLPMLMIAALLFGVGFGLVFPLLNATALDACPSHKRGAASATFSLSIDIGIAGGSMLWGAVIDISGYTATFLGAALFIVLALILFLRIQLPRLNKAKKIGAE